MKSWLTRIFNQGARGHSPDLFRKRIRLANIYTFYFGAICFSYGLFFWTIGIPQMAALTVPFGLSFWSFVLFNRLGYHSFSRVSIIGNGIAILYIYATTFGPEANIHFWLISTMILPFVIFDFKERAFIALTSLSSAATFVFLQVTNFEHSLLPRVSIEPGHMADLALSMELLSLLMILIYIFQMAYDYDNALGLAQNKDSDLKALGARTRVILNDDSIGLWEWDLVNDEMIWSDSMKRFLGLPIELKLAPLLVGDQLVHPDDLSHMASSHEKVLVEGRPQLCEFRLRHSLGHYIWFQTTLNAVRDNRGEIVRFMGVLLDITSRKSAEEDLKRERAREKMIIESTSAIFYTCRATGDFATTFVGGNVRELGWQPSDFISNPSFWSDHIHPEDRESVLHGLDNIFLNDRHQHEYRFQRKDGTYAWVQDTVSLVRNPDGSPREMLGFWADISREKEAIWHLYSLEKAITETAIVSITDRNGKIIYVNDETCRISGYSREEIIGKDHSLFSSGFHDRAFFENLWRTISSGQLWRGEICNRRKDGTLYWVDSSIMALDDLNGNIEKYISIRYDVTERKSAMETMLQTAKMATLGEMAAGIAHEINNPLGIIHGKALQMYRDIQTGEYEEKRFLKEFEKIQETSFRIADIVKGLRAFSRDGSRDPLVLADLSEIIMNTTELCKSRFRTGGVSMKVSVSESISVKCRPTQISQILLNLLNNAYDAVEGSGTPWVDIGFTRSGNKVQVFVRDSGKGIPAEVVTKLMVPFFTTKEVGKGTGIGLSISKGMAEENGGSLRYDSTCANTQFVLELPIPTGHEDRLAS